MRFYEYDCVKVCVSFLWENIPPFKHENVLIALCTIHYALYYDWFKTLYIRHQTPDNMPWCPGLEKTFQTGRSRPSLCLQDNIPEQSKYTCFQSGPISPVSLYSNTSSLALSSIPWQQQWQHHLPILCPVSPGLDNSRPGPVCCRQGPSFRAE